MLGPAKSYAMIFFKVFWGAGRVWLYPNWRIIRSALCHSTLSKDSNGPKYLKMG
ncbi:hypothetical protein PIB30_059493, partial [Stylosanthes scabra]|nr:hypothetical protein [Stylosanthes scabra]